VPGLTHLAWNLRNLQRQVTHMGDVMAQLKLIARKPAKADLSNGGSHDQKTPMTDWARAVEMLAVKFKCSRSEAKPATSADSSVTKINVAQLRIPSKSV